MNAAHKNLARFALFLWLTTGLCVVLAVAFAAYVYSEAQVDRANELRFTSFVLAQELRRSSDDLTRMARTFVATGDPLYKAHFQEILAIRDGKQPRPMDYAAIYWDLVLEDDKRPRAAGGRAVAWLDLLRQAGFTAREFAKLVEAKAKSDALNDIEYAAMDLVEATHSPTEPHRTQAIWMLHDAAYHRAKADIMRAIDEFDHMMDQRTLAVVHAREDIALGLRTLFAVFGLVLVFMLWRTYRALQSVLGGPVDELYAQIVALGHGHFATPIPVSKGMDNSVLAWLSETRHKLARLEAQRQAAVSALADSRELLQSIINTVPVRVFWKDRELRYLGCNPAFARDEGADEPQDLIGKDDYEVNPTLAERYRADDREVMASGQPKLAYEEPLSLPDGREIWLRTSKVPLRDEHNAIIGVLGIYEDITEQRRAYVALRESEARFRKLFNAAPISMAICKQNIVTQINERFIKTFGYTPEDIPTLDDWWPRAYPDPEYRQWVMAAWAERVRRSIADNDYIAPHEYRVTCKNGDPRTVIGSGVAIGDDFLITIIDITERKNAELALHSAEAHIRTLLNTMPVGVVVAEKATAAIVFANGFFCQMFGYDHQQLMGMNIADITPTQERARVMTGFAAAAGHTGIKDSLPFMRRDGGILLVEIRDTEIELEGRPCVLGVFTDISERLALESERERQREILEITVRERNAQLLATSRKLNDTILALERVGTSILWIEVDTGRLLSVNQYAAELLGYSQDELTGLAVCDIDVNLDSHEKYRQVAKEIASKGFLRFDTIHKRKDGHTIPIEMSVYYRPGEAGEPPRLVAFGVDIGERKTAEAALREAKAAAEIAAQAKSSFLSIMSHEIRTPVAGILGLTHIMRRQAEQPEQIQNLDKIAAAGQHLLSVINDVLDISKIEAGKFALEERPLQIETAVANVVSILKARADEKHLELVSEVRSSSRHVLGDPTRLQQAILNYVSNAIKFTRQGRVTIRAWSVADADDSVVWRFEVEDTGIGIAPDILPRLFQAFEQADTSTTRQYGGTGLGLAITRKIATLMGGEVGARSAPGVGSTFWFTGRFKKSAASPPPVECHATQVVEEILKNKYAGSRILVAEDEPINREIATLMLEDLGFVVDAAKDGGEAVALATRNRYQLILMDMLMPNKNGLDATRDIRKLRADIPIIAMTANAFNEDRRACLDAGMNDFLSKPAAPKDIYAMLLKWLSRKTG